MTTSCVTNRTFRNCIVSLLLASALVSFCDALPTVSRRWFGKGKGKTQVVEYDPDKEVLIGFGYSKFIRKSQESFNYHTLHLPVEDLFATDTKPQNPPVLNPTVSLLQRGDFEDELPDIGDTSTRTGLFPYQKCYVTLNSLEVFNDLKTRMRYSSLPSSRLPSYAEHGIKLPTPYEQYLTDDQPSMVVTITSGRREHLVMHFPYETIWRALYPSLIIRCVPLNDDFPEGIEDARWEDWNIPNLPKVVEVQHQSPGVQKGSSIAHQGV